MHEINISFTTLLIKSVLKKWFARKKVKSISKDSMLLSCSDIWSCFIWQSHIISTLTLNHISGTTVHFNEHETLMHKIFKLSLWKKKPTLYDGKLNAQKSTGYLNKIINICQNWLNFTENRTSKERLKRAIKDKYLFLGPNKI